MKYLAVIKNNILLVFVLLINSLGLAGPASAIATTSHEMGNMDHRPYNTSSCAGQCSVVALNKNTEKIQTEDEEKQADKDKPATPFYSTVSNWNFTHKLSQQKQYAEVVQPPPKLPVYIRYAVFRV